jgi:hypothetical protein
MYVVVEDTAWNNTGYAVCGEADLKAFYNGNPIVASYSPDGYFEPGN